MTTRARSAPATPSIIRIRRAEHAQILIDFLDELRAELWSVHGTAIEQQRHTEACQDEASDTQQILDLDEPPF